MTDPTLKIIHIYMSACSSTAQTFAPQYTSHVSLYKDNGQRLPRPRTFAQKYHCSSDLMSLHIVWRRKMKVQFHLRHCPISLETFKSLDWVTKYWNDGVRYSLPLMLIFFPILLSSLTKIHKTFKSTQYLYIYTCIWIYIYVYSSSYQKSKLRNFLLQAIFKYNRGGSYITLGITES